MLNASVLRFDAAGRIRNTIAAPSEFNGGTPTNQGLLCAVLGVATPHHFHDSTGFEATNQLSCEAAPSGTRYTQGGLHTALTGRIGVAVNGTISHHNAGLPCDAAGNLVLATAESPATLNGFSNGFSNGFGAF